jgi:hypothetical protein
MNQYPIHNTDILGRLPIMLASRFPFFCFADNGDTSMRNGRNLVLGNEITGTNVVRYDE